MSFKVLVMSPLHQSGASCVATLLAQSVTYDNKTSTLVYTSPSSNVPDYLGIKSIDDPTRSIMQVVRLIDNNALKDSDILDYTVQFAKNVHMLSLGDSMLPERDVVQIVQHVYNRIPTDICVVDNSDDIDSPVTERLLEHADCVFIVINPNQKDFAHMKYWLTETRLRDVEDVYIVLNNYDPVIGAVRTLSKQLGLAANKVCTMHYNPWIRRCCLVHALHDIVPRVKGMDDRVINLQSDLIEFSQVINSTIFKNAKVR